MDTHLPFVGFVQFPRGPRDLTAAVCPACFVERTATACPNCGLRLDHPAIVELDAASASTTVALERRLELIGRIRYETAGLTAPSASTTTTVPEPAAPTPTRPTPVVAPTALAEEPRPARHLGVQVILLIVGVSLLAVGAIFFLVYAFITFGLVWRSVIIAAVTIAAIAGSVILKRRRLRATAEAIAALGVIFVYLDVFALRANDLAGLGDSEPLGYWGVALLLSGIGFALWHRASGLRLPAVVAFATLAPAAALIVAQLSDGLDGEVRSLLSFAALALVGAIHALAGSALLPRTGTLERTIALVTTAVGLGALALTAIGFTQRSVWDPVLVLLVAAVIATLHVLLLYRTAVGRGWALAFAAFTGLVLAAALPAVALRLADPVFGIVAPALTATTIALLFELLARRLPALRGLALAAAASAALVAGLSLLYTVAVALSTTLWLFVDAGRQGQPPLDITQNAGVAFATLAAAAGLIAAFWALGGVLAARRFVFPWIAGALLVFVVPLLQVLWLATAAWLLLSVLALIVLVWQRRGPVALRLPLAVTGGVALTLGYLSSWLQPERWWIGSVVAIVVLLAARLAVRAPEARAALVLLASILATIAAAAAGRDLNETLGTGSSAALDALQWVGVVALLLLLAVTASRLLSELERTLLFWLGLVLALTVAAVNWVAAPLATTVIPAGPAGLVLGLLLVAALTVIARGSNRAVTTAATAAIPVFLGWAIASLLADAAANDRAFATMIALALAHVASVLLLLVRPFGYPLAWTALGLAGLIGIIALLAGDLRPVEWVTVPIALALLAGGIIRLRREPAAGSWTWLAPGLLVLLVPSLLVTFGEATLWRLVALGVVAVAAVVAGAVGKLQAPLLIGAIVAIIHGLRTFAPQLLAVYQLAEWWLWAVIGGALVVFVAVTFERRARDLKTVLSRISALR